jgi:hypothetical protein
MGTHIVWQSHLLMLHIRSLYAVPANPAVIIFASVVAATFAAACSHLG